MIFRPVVVRRDAAYSILFIMGGLVGFRGMRFWRVSVTKILLILYAGSWREVLLQSIIAQQLREEPFIHHTK